MLAPRQQAQTVWSRSVVTNFGSRDYRNRYYVSVDSNPRASESKLARVFIGCARNTSGLRLNHAIFTFFRRVYVSFVGCVSDLCLNRAIFMVFRRNYVRRRGVYTRARRDSSKDDDSREGERP